MPNPRETLVVPLLQNPSACRVRRVALLFVLAALGLVLVLCCQGKDEPPIAGILPVITLPFQRINLAKENTHFGSTRAKLIKRAAIPTAYEKYTRKGNPTLKVITAHEKEFQELGDLDALYKGGSNFTSPRQHVNPLSSFFQKPTPALDWGSIFADPTLPLHIDVGCGSGRFVLMRALRLSGSTAASDAEVDSEALDGNSPILAGVVRANVLGMEIRQPLVDRANAWAGRLNMTNCHFVFTNVMVSWKTILADYPGPIELVSMQFPDPHFKRRNHKRRHVQPQLVRDMTQTLAVGAQIFLQGDVPEVVRWMRDMIERHGGGSFELASQCLRQNREEELWRDEWETPWEEVEDQLHVSKRDNGASHGAQQLLSNWSSNQEAGWLRNNPLGVPTEREVYVAQIKAPVYRVMLVRVPR